MSRKATATRYMPPNKLQDKIGGPLPDDNPEAIASANNNVNKLSDSFQSWMEEEITRLDAALLVFAKPSNKDGTSLIHDSSHDIKGLAATYGYPLVGRMADCLCRLTFPHTENSSYNPPAKLIYAHVHAIKIAVRDKIKAEENNIASSLASELEAQTRQYLSKHGI